MRQCEVYSADWQEFKSSKDPTKRANDTLLFLSVIAFNTYFVRKEFTQALGLANRAEIKQVSTRVMYFLEVAKLYFKDKWNVVDLSNIFLVYVCSFIMKVPTGASKRSEVTLASLTSLTLTYKSMSFLRGFTETGWLIRVLYTNFWDIRGFFVIMLVVIVGFSSIFRLLLGDLEADPESSSPAPYGSMSRSIFNVFLMSILGDFDTSLFDASNNGDFSRFMFFIVQIYVSLVSLNALIALLGDSYGNVQQNQNANKRYEKVQLVIEYLAVLPQPQLEKLEQKSRIFWREVRKVDLPADGERLYEGDDDENTQAIARLEGEVVKLKETVTRLVCELQNRTYEGTGGRRSSL
jgi:hypothetical protein